MEYTPLTCPHTVGRHDVLTHVSRSALSNYTSPFCSHIAFRMAPGDMGSLVIRTPGDTHGRTPVGISFRPMCDVTNRVDHGTVCEGHLFDGEGEVRLQGLHAQEGLHAQGQ